MENAPDSSKDLEKIILDVSTTGAYVPYPTSQAYGSTKHAFSSILRQAVQDYPNLWVHSFHPGSVYTESVKGFGLSEDALEWDDPNLPGQFAVFLAGEKGRFLKSRFLLSAWDVDELKAVHDELKKDPAKLTLGMRM